MDVNATLKPVVSFVGDFFQDCAKLNNCSTRVGQERLASIACRALGSFAVCYGVKVGISVVLGFSAATGGAGMLIAAALLIILGHDAAIIGWNMSPNAKGILDSGRELVKQSPYELEGTWIAKSIYKECVKAFS